MRQSEQIIDGIAKAIARFEDYNQYRDFRVFHHQQAIVFKKHLTEQVNKQTGKKLSKATLHSTFANLKKFFEWLAESRVINRAFNILMRNISTYPVKTCVLPQLGVKKLRLRLNKSSTSFN